ncbi:hypothetical protein HPP92_003797 [Vanilla planifolia]|uniref:WAT1-related protein n=1 Tax=Vanilla planifolia TaxID=51239 RepID=A0A835VNM1_VANPL|nr:hypothetical protein HPP92_003797 [Vanilla planifolia]
MANAIPAITFVMALALGKEKLEIRGRKGQAKATGTVLTVVGTVLMVLYKGPSLEFLRLSDGRKHQNSEVHESSSWTKGSLLLIGSCCSWAAFLILQSNTMKTYPAALSLTTLVCVMGAVMNAAVALAVEHGNGKPWVLGWDMRLLCAAYSGIICTGVSYFIYGLVTNERGPVFASAFDPLCLIITALLSSMFLAEEITLGRQIFVFFFLYSYSFFGF